MGEWCLSIKSKRRNRKLLLARWMGDEVGSGVIKEEFEHAFVLGSCCVLYKCYFIWFFTPPEPMHNITHFRGKEMGSEELQHFSEVTSLINAGSRLWTYLVWFHHPFNKRSRRMCEVEMLRLDAAAMEKGIGFHLSLVKGREEVPTWRISNLISLLSPSVEVLECRVDWYW